MGTFTTSDTNQILSGTAKHGDTVINGTWDFVNAGKLPKKIKLKRKKK